MARIRTIKPEFYRHHELWSAEHESGLPLRVAYSGLWCVADREGRFKWRPPALKIEILPYDDVDFDAVLEALVRHGFVRRYEVDGVVYGLIPSFVKHQVINREQPSAIPAPQANRSATGRRPVRDRSTKSAGRKGMERNGMEPEGNGVPSETAASDDAPVADAQVPQDTEADAATIVFNQGRQWLVRSTGRPDNHCRSMLGKWRRDYGDERLIAVLGAAQRTGPIDAVQWIEAALRRPPPHRAATGASSGDFNL
jgi:hypothetical protein